MAIWALAVAVALLAVAIAPFGTPGSRLDAARWVVGAHVLWGLTKLVTYDELPASVISLSADAVLLALLWRAAGRERP